MSLERSHLYAEHTAWPRSEMEKAGQSPAKPIKNTFWKVNFPKGIFNWFPASLPSPLLSLGAICQIRTDDLLITSELLYQLS